VDRNWLPLAAFAGLTTVVPKGDDLDSRRKKRFITKLSGQANTTLQKLNWGAYSAAKFKI